METVYKEICFAKLLQDIDSIYNKEIFELDKECSLSQNQIDDLVLERHGKNGGFESRTTVEMNIFYDANYKVEGGYDTVIVEPLENYEK